MGMVSEKMIRTRIIFDTEIEIFLIFPGSVLDLEVLPPWAYPFALEITWQH